MPKTDTRWLQRFQNFDRAFVLLRSALDGRTLDSFSQLEREGLIQRFEFTYELGWKVLKDYLEDGGHVIEPVTPKGVLKLAFAAKVIADGQVWIDMTHDRNRLSHTYDFGTFTSVLGEVVARYLPAFAALHGWLVEKSLEP